MPGSSLYDYGDGVRSTASTASEDEADLSKVFLNEKFVPTVISYQTLEKTSKFS